MMGAYLAAAAAGSALAQGNPVKTPDTVFACQYFRSDRERGDGWVSIVDMRLVERRDGTWTVESANQPAAIATTFPAKFGSVGRSLGLRWRDTKGSMKTAYISFGDDVLPRGMNYSWLSFDRPSLWKTP